MQPIEYRISARRTVIDPRERARRLALLYAIFSKPKTVKFESKPTEATRPEGASDEKDA